VNPAYVADNTTQRHRLVQVTARLSESDLIRPISGGWSVATKLAHLAFWDAYCLAQVEAWERTGLAPAPADIDAMNHAVRTLSEAIPPSAAARLACAAAEAIDQKLERLSAELVTAIEAAGRVRILRRSMHRQEHLDQIEAVLSGRRSGEQ
jgi:hypothetical protein